MEGWWFCFGGGYRCTRVRRFKFINTKSTLLKPTGLEKFSWKNYIFVITINYIICIIVWLGKYTKIRYHSLFGKIRLNKERWLDKVLGNVDLIYITCLEGLRFRIGTSIGLYDNKVFWYILSCFQVVWFLLFFFYFSLQYFTMFENNSPQVFLWF